MANRIYEIMYIVDPDTPDERIVKLNEAVGKVIEKQGGKVIKMDDMGKRALAYPIQKKNEGHYVLFEIEGTGQEIAELERRMRVNDMIMRYITVRIDQDRKRAEKIKAKREKKKAARSRFNEAAPAEDESGQAAA
ncbi:MAG TPA: 30S ribosomal protein S6 [Pyrinomonadaceae bacterium]|nr:30S ribosomal protein S6 [Pyrinomonadaceae bacterium]